MAVSVEYQSNTYPEFWVTYRESGQGGPNAPTTHIEGCRINNNTPVTIRISIQSPALTGGRVDRVVAPGESGSIVLANAVPIGAGNPASVGYEEV